MKKELVEENVKPIFEEIKSLVNSSRERVYTAVNTEMLNLYWNIGKIIMKIQEGKERAIYGKEILKKLSQELEYEFGRGFSVDNLEKMRKFYNTFSISETLSRKFKRYNLEDSVFQIKLVSLFRIN